MLRVSVPFMALSLLVEQGAPYFHSVLDPENRAASPAENHPCHTEWHDES